ncbi:BatA domain-containing protein [Lysobacter niastensis]|uniref:BatA domain-containing protein n=1 Tax=Lysobacter niastensis TaxID=380629 RepID=A0ABS0B5D8_9GAMM|nr:BatA domain-containing protein [Lysobacter niastensis]MBF6024054.1 BatA domain-containing protein [Lysobacter niastensis]
MNLALLLPAGLAALAALLLPLLIHLARRSEQRPTVFAALQWLRQKPRPRHRIRFDEWPLLLVRLLLLALLALLIARPVLFGAEDRQPWVAVAPGIDPHQARMQSAPSNARWHWLTPGFPRFESGARAPAPSRVAITSLLRELDADLAPGVALTVLVPEQLNGVDGQRPVLSRRVDWRVLPGIETKPRAAAVAAAPSLSVRYSPDREGSLRYLRAANAAWQDPSSKAVAGQDIALSAKPVAAQTLHLMWLAPGPLPQAVADWIRNGGVALLDPEATLADAVPMSVLWRDDDGAALVEGSAYGRGKVMRLTRPLQAKAIPQLLDAQFPRQLRGLFVAAAPEPARVHAAAHAPSTGGIAFPVAPRELQPWLLALIAMLFAVERWMASAKRQRSAP